MAPWNLLADISNTNNKRRSSRTWNQRKRDDEGDGKSRASEDVMGLYLKHNNQHSSMPKKMPTADVLWSSAQA